jgi:hypothetical protein
MIGNIMPKLAYEMHQRGKIAAEEATLLFCDLNATWIC